MTEEESETQLTRLLVMFSEKLNHISKFGFDLIGHTSEGKPLKTEHIPVVMSLRHSMELIDGIASLLKSNLADPGMILLRALMESVLQVQYILEKETEFRGKSFMYFDALNRLAQAEKIDETTARGKEFASWIQKDKYLKATKFTIPPTLNAELIALRKQRLIPEYSEIHKEYEFQKSKGKTVKHWFNMFDGPPNIEQLALRIGLGGVYQILYRHLSEAVHGVGVVNGKMETRNGVGAIRASGAPDHIEYVFSTTVFLGFTMLQDIMKAMAPEKQMEFGQLYLKELREPFTRASANQYIEILK